MSLDGILKGHDLFRSLSVDQAHGISDFSTVKKFDADDVIFSHNDPAGHIYMLMEGAVDLRLPSEGQDFSLVISKIEKGELFGLSPLLDSPRYTATAQCVEATEVLSIEAKPLRELLKRNSLVGFEIINQVAHIYFKRYIEILKRLQGVVGQVSLIR
ncbi:MAG: cyclic nucleotide-binding domain-containing protein [Candidatus Zixiibacteriota bacterium]